jgi:hypothetical protein
MANDISDAWKASYADDVKLTFQRKGSLLLNLVRRKTGVNGSTHTFFTLGSGQATRKSRNGLVIPMNPAHASATATLVDRYAPEYVDKLDELKIGYDEKQELVSVGAWALGRAADQDIIDVLDAATTYKVAHGSANITLKKLMEALYDQVSNYGLFARNVDDDGQVTAVIGPSQWAELSKLQQFASADYVGPKYPLLSATSAKRWLNVTWIMHSGLSKATYRLVHFFHKNAIGHASGQDITTEINYVADRAAHLVNSMMSMGAVLIETAGVTQMECTDVLT